MVSELPFNEIYFTNMYEINLYVDQSDTYGEFRAKTTRLKPPLFFLSITNGYRWSQKMTHTNFQIFSKISLPVMVAIVDLSLSCYRTF